MAEEERSISHQHSSSASRSSNVHSGPSLLNKKSAKKDKDKQKEKKDKSLLGDKGYMQFEADEDPFPTDLGSFRSRADPHAQRDRFPKAGKLGKTSFKIGKGVSDKPRKEPEKIKSQQLSQAFSPAAGEDHSSVEHSEAASSSFGASSFFAFSPTRGANSSVASGGGGGELELAAGDERALFGVPLAVAVARSPSHDGIRVPLFMRLCLCFVEQNGLKSEGIYRVSGLKSKITALRNAIQQTPADAPQIERAFAEYSEYAVSGVIKQFFKELPESLLTDALTPTFEATCGIAETQARTAELKKLLAQLPSANYMTLAMLVVHMLHVIANQKTNRMNLQNLSIVLSPSLRISHRVLSVLLAGPAIVVRELFPAHEQLSPARPYAPPVSVRAAVGATSARLTLDLPDTLPLLEAELIKQNSVLAQLHRQIAARADAPAAHDAAVRTRGARKGSALLKAKDSRASAAAASTPGDPTDEHLVELWEVQKLITALKRKKQLLSLATSEAIDAEVQKLAANLEKLHEDVTAHNASHEPLSPAAVGAAGGAQSFNNAPLSPTSHTSHASASSTAAVVSSPSACAAAADAKKDATECAECQPLQDELWALQCTVTMLKRRMKRAKKGELSDEVRQAEQLRRMQETAFGQRLLAPLPEKSAPAAEREAQSAPVVKPVPLPAPKQTDIDEEIELNLELATPAVQPTRASEQQPQKMRATPAAETTRRLLAEAPGTTQAFHDTPPIQVLPEHNLHDRSTTTTSKPADGPKAPASAAAAASSAIPNATAPESAVSNISLSSLVNKRGSSGSVGATAALTQSASATAAHPSSALSATEPLPESTAEAPSASDATMSAARPRASSAESLAKKSPQRTSTVAPSHHRSTDAALESTRAPEQQQQQQPQTPSASKSADSLVLDLHLSASTRPADNKALATGAEGEPASDDESDNSDAGEEEGGADMERTRLPDQESDAASLHSESLASFMEASNQEEMETLLLDEDDEDTRNLYDEYLKLKYSNEELKLIEDELRHKIDEEKREIERLRLEIANYTGSKPAIPLSPPLVPQRRSLQVAGGRQQSIAADDPSQLSDDELRALYERLAQDNERMRRENASLVARIEQERSLCAQVKVQLRLLQRAPAPPAAAHLPAASAAAAFSSSEGIFV